MATFVAVIPYMGECCSDQHAEVVKIVAENTVEAEARMEELSGLMEEVGFYPEKESSYVYPLGEIESIERALENYRATRDEDEAEAAEIPPAETHARKS